MNRKKLILNQLTRGLGKGEGDMGMKREPSIAGMLEERWSGVSTIGCGQFDENRDFVVCTSNSQKRKHLPVIECWTFQRD